MTSPAPDPLWALVAQWRGYCPADAEGDYGYAAGLDQCANELEAMLQARAADHDAVMRRELEAAILPDAERRATWDHKAVVSLAIAHREDSEILDRYEDTDIRGVLAALQPLREALGKMDGRLPPPEKRPKLITVTEDVLDAARVLVAAPVEKG